MSGHKYGVAFQVFNTNLGPSRVDPGGYAVSTRYQVLPPTAPVPAPDDVLERVVREGAERILAEALKLEVSDFLQRLSYERASEFRGYRNGHLPSRTIGTGMGAVTVKVPRVSDVPKDVTPDGYHSEIVVRYERRSKTQERLLVRLYLEGLSSGDFEPVFRALVGDTAALSPTSILRLRAEWEAEYVAWRARSLTERYVYIWADGIYLKAGLEREKTAVLVIIGVRADGKKELLAMDEGYRESTVSWAEVLRSLRDRGLTQAPLVAVGDGGLGFWAALDEVYPTTRHQRCWNHRAINVIDKLPRRLQATARKALRTMWEAPTRPECVHRRDAYCAELRAQGQAAAAACVERDWDDFVTFYDFPQEHWRHLRTSNPIESVFAGVRLRTDAAKRMRVRENALYMVFKLVTRLSLTWRSVDAPNQLTLLLLGHKYVDGRLQLVAAESQEGVAA